MGRQLLSATLRENAGAVNPKHWEPGRRQVRSDTGDRQRQIPILRANLYRSNFKRVLQSQMKTSQSLTGCKQLETFSVNVPLRPQAVHATLRGDHSILQSVVTC